MKSILLSALFLFAFSFAGFSQETETKAQETETKAPEGEAIASAETVTFGVRGNCGSCKRVIDKAAMIDGVSEADWDVEDKAITVTYDPAVASLDDIHASIAQTGYDTDKVSAEKKNYNKITGCCKYNRKMKMSRASDAEGKVQ